jgi:hypothetical protein
MDGYTVLRGILPYRFSYGFHQFENRIRAFGSLSILLVLFVFSFFLAQPFYDFVLWIFTLLVGH